MRFQLGSQPMGFLLGKPPPDDKHIPVVILAVNGEAVILPGPPEVGVALHLRNRSIVLCQHSRLDSTHLSLLAIDYSKTVLPLVYFDGIQRIGPCRYEESSEAMRQHLPRY